MPVKGLHDFDPFPTADSKLAELKELVRTSVLFENIAEYSKYHFAIWPDCKLYPYQVALSEAIISPPPEKRMAILAPRQTGKSITIIYTILYLMDKMPNLKVGIFAPKESQATTIIFKGVRDRAEKCEYYKRKIKRSKETDMELANGSRIFAQAASPTSKIVGSSLNIAVVDEAQDVEEDKIIRDIIPMLGAFDGLLVLIGTASTKRCYLYEARRNPAYKSYTVKSEEALVQNVRYRNHVEKARLERGEDDPLFRTQYLGEWVLERGMFIEQEVLDGLQTDKIKPNPDETHYAGWDPANKQDRSVITIMNDKGQIVRWLSFDGDDYTVQCSEVAPILKAWNVRYITVDASGPQDAVYQLLDRILKERGIPCKVAFVKTNELINHNLYSALKKAIKDREVSYPSGDVVGDDQKTDWYRFRQDMLALEVTYKDYIMRVRAPDKRGVHDDYASSLILCWDTLKSYGHGRSTATGGWAPIISHDRVGMKDVTASYGRKVKLIFPRRKTPDDDGKKKFARAIIR